jgi:hypothetical protein
MTIQTYPQGWRTQPPERRQWALVWWAGAPYLAQWEPILGKWVVEGRRAEPADTPWHPLPAPPDGSDVSAWCAVEES